MDGVTSGASSIRGEDGRGGEEDHEDGWGRGSDVSGIFWKGGKGIVCGAAGVVISGVGDSEQTTMGRRTKYFLESKKRLET